MSDLSDYAMSPSHARGLRRDLFRAIQGRVGTKLPPFERSWNALCLPYRSAREANATFRRTGAALRACSYGCHARDKHFDGLILVPATRIHGNGRDEPILEVRNASLRIDRGIPTGSVRTLGTISHHAVERMFQRLNTTSTDDVLQDILGFSLWIRLMQVVSIVAPDSRNRIEQLPIPTSRGMFLCVRETDTWEVHMRTWVPHGFSQKYDASGNSLATWFCGIKPDSDTNVLIASFDAMAARPENDWWLSRHPDARRCEYG